MLSCTSPEARASGAEGPAKGWVSHSDGCKPLRALIREWVDIRGRWVKDVRLHVEEIYGSVARLT